MNFFYSIYNFCKQINVPQLPKYWVIMLAFHIWYLLIYSKVLREKINDKLFKAENIDLKELKRLVAKHKSNMKENWKKSQPPSSARVNNTSSHRVNMCTNEICKHCSHKHHKETRCWHKHRYPSSRVS